MRIVKDLRILILEDNEDDVMLIKHTLVKDGLAFISEWVTTRDEFLLALADFQPNVILSDHGLPGFNSSEALKISTTRKSIVPFILVTGLASDEFAISCLRKGADDYILKSNLSRLPIAIRAALKKRKLAQLKRVARHSQRAKNKQLVKANRELDNFVYSVSHNLRGPLVSVMGLLNLAAMTKDKKEMDQLHTMMSGSILKLDNTIKEILDYSHNSRDEVQFELVNWEELIRTSFLKLDYLLNGISITKTISLQNQIPFFSDQARISVILTNLLSNAILYRDERRGLIIEIDVISSAYESLVIIKDNGAGISNEVLPKIFNMFFRGTILSKGAGLGLYIAKEMITRLKGKVHVDSVYGQGTTVKISIPNKPTQFELPCVD